MREGNDIIKSDKAAFVHCFKDKVLFDAILRDWSYFVMWSLNLGNSHFSFKLLLSEFEAKHYKDFFKKHPIYFDYITCVGDKKFNDYFAMDSSLSFSDGTLQSFIDDIHAFTKLDTWFYVIAEEDANGIVYLRGCFAVRNLMDFNKNFLQNLLKKFDFLCINHSLAICNLSNFASISRFLSNLHFKKNLVFRPT